MMEAPTAKSVTEARRNGAEKDRARKVQERAYYFMLAIAGDLPGCEEATRALFAGDRAKLERETATSPGTCVRTRCGSPRWRQSRRPHSAGPHGPR